jgi:hypothetical protein
MFLRETVTNLASAGMYGEIDRIDGVREHHARQVVPCGTGDTILLLDNDQLDDIEGEVAKRSRPVSSLSERHDPGFGHAVQPTPFQADEALAEHLHG